MGADERAFDSKCKAVVLAGSVLPLHLIDTWGDSLLKKSMREMLRKNVGQGKPCSECAQRSSGSNQSLASETSFLYNLMWQEALIFPVMLLRANIHPLLTC